VGLSCQKFFHYYVWTCTGESKPTFVTLLFIPGEGVVVVFLRVALRVISRSIAFLSGSATASIKSSLVSWPEPSVSSSRKLEEGGREGGRERSKEGGGLRV